jgi:hypothetical protein
MSQLAQNTILSDDNTQSRLKETPENLAPAPEGGETKSDPFAIFSDALPQELRATRNSRHESEQSQQSEQTQPLVQTDQLNANQQQQQQQQQQSQNQQSPSARSRNRPSPRMYRRVSSTITAVTPVANSSRFSSLDQPLNKQDLMGSTSQRQESTESQREIDAASTTTTIGSADEQSDLRSDLQSSQRSQDENLRCGELEKQEQEERDQLDQNETKEWGDLDNKLHHENEKKKEPGFFSKIAAHIHLPLLHHHSESEDVNRGSEDNHSENKGNFQ